MMNTDARKKAIEALDNFHGAICVLEQHAYFDHDGLAEVVGEHDGNDEAAQHMLIAFNLLENAALHIRLARLSLESLGRKG